MGCRRYSAASRLEVLLDEDDFRSSLTSSWTRKLFASFKTACDSPGTPKSTSRSSTFTGLSVLVWSSSSIFYRHWNATLDGFNPTTGLTVLVECSVPSWPNKISFSISWVDSCPPTGLTVLDNWVFGFGGIRWESLLLPATCEPNSFIQSCFKEIFGGRRGDTYTFSYVISPDSITTTFEILKTHLWLQCVLMSRHSLYKRCKAIALLQSTHKHRALKPKGSANDTSWMDGWRCNKNHNHHRPALMYTGKRDLLNPMAYEQKKKLAPSMIWLRSLCVVVQFQLVVELHDLPTRFFSPFNVYIPVRSKVNNGSECAPLNFVMASAAFRLCGHHRRRHITLRINSSMIGTSSADFRSSCGK